MFQSRRNALLAACLSVGLGSAALAYELESSTIDGGGATVTGGTYLLSGTIGQPDAGVATGGSYELRGGFWPTAGITSLPVVLGDMNCDGSVDGRDIEAFTVVILSPSGYGSAYPGCHVANGDFDLSGAVTIADVQAFTTFLLNQP